MYLVNNFIMKLFRNTCFLFPLILLCTTLQAQALQIVYPKNVKTEISASSTFIIGNTIPESSLKINNQYVKVYENGSFVQVVPLNDGENTIDIESKKDNTCDKVTYIIKKVPKTTQTSLNAQLEEFGANQFLYSTVIKDNTPLRAQPDENAKRITHLNHNTVVIINGKKGDYYRVSLTPEENAWIRADNVVNYSTVNEKVLASASKVIVTEDKLYHYIKTDLTFKTPFKITETENGLTLELYSIKNNAADTMLFKTSGELKNLAINTTASDGKSTYFIELNNKLWGYDAFYEGHTLVIKIRKAPHIDKEKPLKDITIALDAGHGGADSGAIGPTGVKEKDINLDIVQKLQQTLEKAGAKVVLTRTDDTNVPLYDRPQKAKDSDALIFISMHANALADGADPYAKHGTSVFYYNPESFELAKTLKDTMTAELGTKDDGLCKCSFVVTRPTMPLSVLIEVAYMIHPDEYKLLLDESFRQKAAEAVQKGIEQYLLNSVNNIGAN